MSAPNCDRLRSHFDDFHDGLLSPALFDGVQNHLSACATCKEEYGLLVSCIDVIRGLEAPAAPPRALRKIVDTLSIAPPDPDLERGLELS